MLLSSTIITKGLQTLRFLGVSIFLAVLFSACQFKPLYQDDVSISGNSTSLSSIEVSPAHNRVGQQFRNHLLFLLTGGNPAPVKTHEVRIRINYSNRLLAVVSDNRDSTAGSISVIASYDLIDKKTGKVVMNGTRSAIADYDRTGQVYANVRAERDAENRAAKEAAEAVKLALAAGLSTN